MTRRAQMWHERARAQRARPALPDPDAAARADMPPQAARRQPPPQPLSPPRRIARLLRLPD